MTQICEREVIPAIFYESPCGGLLHIVGGEETLCGIIVTREWLFYRDVPAYTDWVCKRCQKVFNAGMAAALLEDPPDISTAGVDRKPVRDSERTLYSGDTPGKCETG